MRYHCKRTKSPKPTPKSVVEKIGLPTIKAPFVTRKEIDEYFGKKGFKNGL